MMRINPSKQKVINAASALFFQKGFDGTSVRDIAEKANVNVSMISYYFKGKQGLLEYAVISYYEEYLNQIETGLEETKLLLPAERLNELVFTIIEYKQMNYQLTCFIQRELSLDSVFVREMTVTYLAKENYYIREIFYEALATNRETLNREYLLLHLKGMLITPYILHNEWKDKVVGDYSQQVFVKKYTKIIQQWLDTIIPQYKTVSNDQ